MDLIEQYISVDPQICHGKPCFKGTRIMVYLVLEMLEAGISVETIVGNDYYPQLTPEHIKAALRYAACVLQFREFDPAVLKAREALYT